MMDMLFQDIVAPIPPAKFVHEFYGSQAIRLKLRQPPAFGVDDFERLLWDQEALLSEHLSVYDASGAIPLPRRREGKDLFRWAIERGRQGSVLRFVSAHRVLPWAARLAGDSAHHLIASVEIDVLLVPCCNLAGACGLLDGAPDLIIVQSAGRSRWCVEAEAACMSRLPERQDTGHVELAPGDVLYLPKAWVGGICTEDAFSVCAVLRVLPKTRADLLRALIEAVTEQDSRFRRTVSQDPYRMARSYAKALQALELYGKSPELLRRAWEKLRIRLADEHRPLPGGHFAAARAAGQFGTNDQVRQRSGVSMAVSRTPTNVYVYVAGLGGVCARESEPGGLLFPPDAMGLVSAIANSQGTFCISDLPDEYSERARLATVRRLIEEGALEVVVSSSREYGAFGACP